ncbi:MAG: hypothetical protein JWO62_313 [Acidimicrobiaceae bacterium]|nr:hypothetical protein [Acidimicrobiaceae bacterium]
MTGRLGIEPDEIMVRGSRGEPPAVPKGHAWRVVSKAPGLRVDEHLFRIVDRLNDHAAAIGNLATELRVAAPDQSRAGSALGIVRHFDDDDGDEEELWTMELPDGGELEKLPGQHQLLGWVLDDTILQFLVATHAHLDVDESG